MKRNYKTKSMVLLITLMSTTFLLLGCSTAETKKQNTSQETTETVKEEEIAVEVEVEEAETVEPETESSSEETTETVKEEEVEVEETETVEQETAISQEPVEVIKLADYGTIENYFNSLDSDKLAIVVFNPEEGYVINMQEGQYYHLKGTDQILFNFTNAIGYGFDFSLGNEWLTFENYTQFLADYSKIQEKHKFFLNKELESGETIELTCYFDPPTE